MRKASPPQRIVAARSQLILDFDVERFGGAAGDFLGLGMQTVGHEAVGHAAEQLIGFGLQLGRGGFDDEGRDAVLAEGFAQLQMQAMFVLERHQPILELGHAVLAGFDGVEFLLLGGDLLCQGMDFGAQAIELEAFFSFEPGQALEHFDACLELLQGGFGSRHFLLHDVEPFCGAGDIFLGLLQRGMGLLQSGVERVELLVEGELLAHSVVSGWVIAY